MQIDINGEDVWRDENSKKWHSTNKRNVLEIDTNTKKMAPDDDWVFVSILEDGVDPTSIFVPVRELMAALTALSFERRG